MFGKLEPAQMEAGKLLLLVISGDEHTFKVNGSLWALPHRLSAQKRTYLTPWPEGSEVRFHGPVGLYDHSHPMGQGLLPFGVQLAVGANELALPTQR